MVDAMFGLLVVLTSLTALRAADPDGEPRLRRLTGSWLVLWGLVVVPSLMQHVVPALLPALQRDWPLVLDGQVWRMLTSVVVQDGGIAGSVFNLGSLAIVLAAAQEYWTGARAWLTFWTGAVLSNLIVGPQLNPVGAGNSMATFALGTALTMNALLSRPPIQARISGIAALLGVVLIGIGGDYHVWACLIGLLTGLIPPWGPGSLRDRRTDRSG